MTSPQGRPPRAPRRRSKPATDAAPAGVSAPRSDVAIDAATESGIAEDVAAENGTAKGVAAESGGVDSGTAESGAAESGAAAATTMVAPEVAADANAITASADASAGSTPKATATTFPSSADSAEPPSGADIPAQPTGSSVESRPEAAGEAEPAPQPIRKKSAGSPAKRPQLRKPLRTALLTLHIIVSVGWNGVAFCQLVLASTAAIDPDLRHPAYELMHVIDRTLNIPLALLTLITGVVLSVKTRWGLLRHWWIVVKLSITVVAVISGGAVIRTLIVASAKHSATAAAGYPAQTVALVVCGTVMNLLFITATVLSTTKPWGRTPRGRREARALTATPRPQPEPPLASSVLPAAS